MDFITLGIILLIVVGVISIPVYLIPWLIKKGIGSKDTQLMEKLFEMVSILTNALNIDDGIKKDIQIVIDVAQTAVAYVEQTMKDASNEEKKAHAVQTVERLLLQMHVEITDDIRKLIDFAIESAVNGLPKTNK